MVTTETLDKYNTDKDSWHPEFKECLKEHNAFNDFLESRISDKRGIIDWGGHYATWLNNYGIYHQTDNGWWNENALNPDNYNAFILEQTTESEEVHSAFYEALNTIKKVSKCGNFITNKTVPGIVEIITGLKI